jgi:hypothetical protein
MKRALVAGCLSLIGLLAVAPIASAQRVVPTREEYERRQAEERRRAEQDRKERQRRLDEERAAREERDLDERRQREQQRKEAERQQREAAEAANRAKLENDKADWAAYKADLVRFKSSCEDIAKLIEKASTPGLSEAVAWLYKQEIDQRRSTRKYELQERLRWGMIWITCESADEVRQARAGILQVKADLDELRCHDASAANALDPKVQEWIPQREAGIADDERCLAQKGCMAKRIAQRLADELCPAIERRDEVMAEITRIRRYGKEVGVVNTKDLYDLGEELKILDEEIGSRKAQYVSTTKKTFTRAACTAP